MLQVLSLVKRNAEEPVLRGMGKGAQVKLEVRGTYKLWDAAFAQSAW